MSKRSIVLIGGGGHCKSCIDLIESTGLYVIIGIVDNEIKDKVLNVPIIGKDSDLPKIAKEVDCFAITVGQIKNNEIRKKLFSYMLELNMDLPVIVSKRAYISHYALIGKGTMIFHDVIVNSNVNIGENCIINNKVLIEHDAKVGSHSHISTGAIINGNVTLEDNCFVGSGAIIKQGIIIRQGSIIGMGARILKEVPAYKTIF